MARPPAHEAFLYQQFWCEENIWQLAQHAATSADERVVVVLTGASGHVACWQQKAHEEGEGVLWDYHVVLATKSPGWQVWDLDTRLGMPVPSNTWLRETFPYPDFVPPEFQPRFAVFEAKVYVDGFDSDRSHMRGKSAWLKPPPPWPAIRGNALSLQDILKQARTGLRMEELRARLG